MKRIAITGGIGSGKSFVCRLLAQRGIQVYDCDAAAILIDGYSSINNSLTSDEIQSAFRKICFELGLRYYTDAISKEKKFKVHYPGYRLGKAKTLLAIADQ